MSDWTYVHGGLEFSCSPFEIKKSFKEVEPKPEDFDTKEAYEKAVDKYRAAYHKAIYLPFPEEQFKLGAPIIGSIPDKTKKKRKDCLGFMSYPERPAIRFDGTVIYSLPKAKPILEEAFKLFPQGELGFRYSLDQNNTDWHSSISGFIHPCLFKYYHEAIDKMYKNFSHDWKSGWSYEDLAKYIKVEEDCGYETVTSIICGISTSLRYALAENVTESLEKFIKYLDDNDISITNGYLEWHDSYSAYDGYCWAFRPYSITSGGWLGEYAIMKLDLKTNEIIWQKKHVHPRKDDGHLDFNTFVDIEESFRDPKPEVKA